MEIKKIRHKPVIAVDIDDVIAAHALGFVEWSNQKYGTHLTVDDYQDHWSEVWKVEREETERRAVEYHESGHIATYGTIEGAKEALEKLKERFRLVVLTRRNSINQLTKEWIEKYYPGIFDEMIFPASLTLRQKRASNDQGRISEEHRSRLHH